MNNLYEVHFFAEVLIKSAGELIKRKLMSELVIDTKVHAHDFVTNIDKEVEAFFRENIQNQYPTHRIIGEEGTNGTDNFLQGIVWGIDPIDGTSNLVYKQEDFAISVGIYVDGVGELAYIYDVVADKFYHAKKGAGAYMNQVKLAPRQDRLLTDSLVYTRFNYLYENKCHVNDIINVSRGLGHMDCASLGFVELGKGAIDAMIGKGGMKFWDIAAGKLFAEECGVSFQGMDGTPYKICESKDIIGAGPKLTKEIMNVYDSFSLE